jgi:magnesium chelatase family protein
MLASVSSATVIGSRGRAITVEVHVGQGLPSLSIVGLPDEACREARDRVRAAVLSSRLEWPVNRITINLAPSNERKGGAGLDLAIAVGVLVATGQLPPEAIAGHGFLGELGLDGSLRPVVGAAPMVHAMSSDVVVVAPGNVREAQVATEGPVRVACHLGSLVRCLTRSEPWPDVVDPDSGEPEEPVPDLADVRGQPTARLALEVAAAGGHHVLFSGSPGSGKTMLASRLPGLLPPLDAATAIDATMIRSAAGVGLPAGGMVRRPPFRSPHHSSSLVALIGGGTSQLRPGEVSLAHGGSLFLDELGEFSPSVLDSLRQPLEEGVVRVARARANATLPARFLLVAATNPCPCGGGPPGSCVCDEASRSRYLRRLSGPLLDRMDLRVTVERPEIDDLVGGGGAEPTMVVAQRVAEARRRALDRAGVVNALIPGDRLDEFAPLSSAAAARLRTELERQRLTGRGYHRVRRVALTLADLGGDDGPLTEERVLEALALRVRLGALGRSAAA